MVESSDKRPEKDNQADQNEESEQDCSSDEFQDMDNFPDEEEDNTPNVGQNVQVDKEFFKNFDVDGLNRMTDLTKENFAKAAHDFMQAIGEDNIFMSGLNWLSGTATSAEKRKYVRIQIDQIMCQIFNMQLEMNQPRDTLDVKHRKSLQKFDQNHREMRIESMENQFRLTTLQELAYLEKQVFEVAQHLMHQLKHQSEEQSEHQNQENVYGQAVANMFQEYAASHGVERSKLTIDQLLEYLKRLVFKAAICIERYHYIKAPPVSNTSQNQPRSKQFHHKPQEQKLNRLEVQGERFFAEIFARNSLLVQINRKLGKKKTSSRAEHSDESDDANQKTPTTEVYDELRDFNIRKCLSKQIVALNEYTYSVGVDSFKVRTEYDGQDLLDKHREEIIQAKNATPEQLTALKDKLQELGNTENRGQQIRFFELTEILYDQNKEQIYSYKDVEKVVNAIEAYTAVEASEVKRNPKFYFTDETENTLMQESDCSDGEYSLYLRLEKILDEILYKKTDQKNNDTASTFRSMAVIVYIIYYLQSRINSLKTLNRDNDSAIEKCKKFIEFWEIEFKPKEPNANQEGTKKTKQTDDNLEQSCVEEDLDDPDVFSDQENNEESKQEPKTEEEKQEEKKQKDLEQKQKEEAEKFQRELEITSQAKRFFLAQLWIQNLSALLEFFVATRAFESQDIKNGFIAYFGARLDKIQPGKFKLPNQEQFKNIGQEYNFSAQELELEESDVKKWTNLPRQIIAQIIKMFKSSVIYRLSAKSQVCLVKELCRYVNNQIKDIRLRNERSDILKGVIRWPGKADQKATVEKELAQEAYEFLLQQLKWEATFNRSIKRKEDNVDKEKKEIKNLILQDSDHYVKWLFFIREDENKNQDPDLLEKYTMVMYQLLLNFNESNIKMLVEVKSSVGVKKKSTRRNLIDMLEVMQDKLDKVIEFEEPFKRYFTKFSNKLMATFCRNLYKMLLHENRESVRVNEFRPLFAYNWIIMLQNYINRRSSELEEEGRKESDTLYRKGSGKLFKDLLHFWGETKITMNQTKGGDIKILAPSNSLAKIVRENYIEKLITFVMKDQYQHTIYDLLQFLFLYDEITHQFKVRSQDDPKLISMLPILVKISEKLLFEVKNDQELNQGQKDKQFALEYQKHALNFKDWLRCTKKHTDRIKECKECQKNQDKNIDTDFKKVGGPIILWLKFSVQQIYQRNEELRLRMRYIKPAEDDENVYDLLAYFEQQSEDFRTLQKRLFFKYLSQQQGSKEDMKKTNEEPKDKYRIKDEAIDAFCKHFDAEDHGESGQTNSSLKDRLKKGINVSKNDIKLFLIKWRQQVQKKITVKHGPTKDNQILQRMFGTRNVKKSEIFKELPEKYLRDKVYTDIMLGNLDKFTKTTNARQEGDESRVEKSEAMINHFMDKLPQEIEEENKEWRDQELKYKITTRPKDEINQAYCNYALIKAKQDFDIYQKREEILTETQECQQRFLNAKNDYLIDQESASDDDDDEEESKMPKEKKMKPLKEKQITFLKAEIPFLMLKAIKWINKRSQEKKMDTEFMKTFYQTKGTNSTQMQDATEKLITDFRTFDGEKYITAQKKPNSFYPLESFEVKQWQIRNVIHQDTVLQEISKNQKQPIDEINETNQHIITMQEITEQIADFDEAKIADDMVILPNYCGYYHLQFWGKLFAPELTYSPHGFVLRRKKAADLIDITKEFAMLFPRFYEKGGKIVSRQSPMDLPAITWEKPKGFDENHDAFSHNQKLPLIAVCFDLEPMTKDMKRLYRERDFLKERKSAKVVEEDQINLDKNKAKSNRNNFSQFLDNNYNKYFYKQTRVENQIVVEQTKMLIRLELNEWQQKSKEDGEFRDDRRQVITKKDWEEHGLGKRWQEMCGQIEPVEIPKIWKDMEKNQNNEDEKLKREREEKDSAAHAQGGRQGNQRNNQAHQAHQAHQEIDREIVEERLNRIFAQIGDFKDSNLTVFEMPRKFPTGFFFQEVKNSTHQRIMGTRFQNDTLQKAITKCKNALQEYDSANKKYNSTKDNLELKRKYAFQVNSSASQLFKATESNFASDVGGGYDVTLNRFFPLNGIHRVSKDGKFAPEGPLKRTDKTHKRFHELLNIFKSSDELFKQLQFCLERMSDYRDKIPELEKLPGIIEGSINSATIQSYQTKLDKLVKKLEDLRNFHQIDSLMARERDLMDDSDDDD